MTVAALRKILCVEDEPVIQAVARAALERLGGFTVLVCASGKEALAAAPGFAPDLILLDVMMPEMDGPATLAQLRLLPGTARTPAAFMTTVAQARGLGGHQGLGAIGLIVKPFDPKTLVQSVQRMWAEIPGHDADEPR